MYAAVDITEKKLKNQLHKYKEKHAGPTIRRRLMGRFKQQPVTTL
jgi:ribosome-associated translation inhibitor RaiA